MYQPTLDLARLIGVKAIEATHHSNAVLHEHCDNANSPDSHQGGIEVDQGTRCQI